MIIDKANDITNSSRIGCQFQRLTKISPSTNKYRKN
jgi:hypothetical protein